MEDSKRNNVKAEFNEAANILWRIGQILAALNIATVDEDFGKQFRLLKVLWKELMQHMKKFPEDRDHHTKRYEEALKVYLDYSGKLKTGKTKTWLDVTECFDTWEIELRDFHQKTGAGMPDKKDYSYMAKRK